MRRRQITKRFSWIIFRVFTQIDSHRILDEEMRNRLLEAMKSAAPGKIPETMFSFAENREVRAWIVGRFLGDDQAFSDWVVETIENIPDVQSDIQYETDFEVPFEVPEDLPVSNRSPEMPETQQSSEGKNVSFSVQPEPVIASPATPSVSDYEITQERMSQIRETLLRYGTDEGLLQLAETDPDATAWILERFHSPEELDEWLAADKGKQAPAEDSNQERPHPNTQSWIPPKPQEDLPK